MNRPRVHRAAGCVLQIAMHRIGCRLLRNNSFMINKSQLVNGAGRTLAGAFVAMAALVCAPSSRAADVRCDTCTSEVSASVKARQTGVGLHHIYNIPAGKVWRYQVEREPAPGGVYTWLVYQETVDPKVTDVVVWLAQVHAQTGGTMKLTVEATLPNIGIFTAFDVSRPGGQRTALLDWAQNATPNRANLPAQVTVALHSLAASALNIWRDVQVETLVLVRFPDGSKAILKYDALAMSFSFVEGSELDAAGNPIPDTVAEVLGINFDFTRDPSGYSLERQLDNARRMGIPVVDVRPGSRIACVKVGERVTCTRY
jgi:hypothetical protein